MARLADPVCDASSGIARCPEGSSPYASAEQNPGVCRIGDDPDGPISAMSGSIVRIPTEDGRCIWIAESVRLKTGGDLSDVAFEVPAQPFRTCPRTLLYVGGRPRDRLLVHHIGADLRWQITGGYLVDGKSRVTYRQFRVDPSATFGLRDEGTGLGHWDSQLQSIVLDPPEPRFATDLDYGNASFVSGSDAYLWGCNRPVSEQLVEGCLLGRFDAHDDGELYLGQGFWSRTSNAGAGAVTFTDGPWISSVVADATSPGQLQHFFVAAFDRSLQVTTAAVPEGPWNDNRIRAALAVPAKPAFAAGPVVHEELADPTRPNEVVVSYDVDTTDPAVTDHLGFGWSQLEWL